MTVKRLPFFTDPYPDELLYSACARYCRAAGHRAPNEGVADLFGAPGGHAVLDFPQRLGHLVSALPPGHVHTVNGLIDDHTMLPLHAPFLPPDRVKFVREAMAGKASLALYKRLTIGGVKVPTHLRFCPECITQDIKSFDEPYWHRAHQITGAKVCHRHAVFLEISHAEWRNRTHKQAFVTANDAVRGVKARRLNLREPTHKFLMRLAKDAAWLLNWRGPSPDPTTLRFRYHNLLLARGLAYYNGRIRCNELLRAVTNFYSPDFLKSIGMGLVVGEANWLLRLVRSRAMEFSQHPLGHLLLITFLGLTVEEVFTKFEEFTPFGAGPWPCLNPAADHYRQPVVSDHFIRERVKGRPGVRGVFKCACGFAYLRIGPDKSTEDRFRHDHVFVYGELWEKALENRLQDATTTVSGLAGDLGVLPDTAIRQALRLRLPLDRINERSRLEVESAAHRGRKPRETVAAAMPRRKADWLELRAKNPSADRGELIKLAPYAYHWLREHATEWFEENLPEARRVPPPLSDLNWDDEDKHFATAVIAAARKIKEQPGEPVRVTLSRIIREVGRRHWFESCLHKLPRTKAAVEKHVEFIVDFYVRKVRWAAVCFIEEGVRPTRLQLMKRAKLWKAKHRMDEAVQKAVDDALRLIKARAQKARSS
ncbi:MAG TPA: TnsD family Tn7-like transposition protein [Pyrinomonadaceae bacterium]|jgi:hypothetical protein